MGKNNRLKFKHITKNEGYLDHVKEQLEKGNSITNSVRDLCDKFGLEYSDNLRRRFSERLQREAVEEDGVDIEDTTTETNQYEVSQVLSARKPNGQIMNIQEYCDYYNIPREEVRSYKLVTHTGVPFYNIASGNVADLDEVDIEEVKAIIAEGIKSYKYEPKDILQSEGEAVVTIADLHFGAYIDNLLKTKPFNINILSDMLNEIAEVVNKKHKGCKVHVHILGDIIESFTGLNHINSWKGLQKGMIGAEAVKLATTVLHKDLLNNIEKLASVKIISGNHDRVTSNKAEDTDGDVANLVSWGLELIGYNVEYNPFILTHLVDGINYILLHGHDSISKKTTKDICWDYGKQGFFNFITEGHLHSIIEKLSVAQRRNYSTVKDDSVDHRRMNCPSLFRGNSYSERLGYTSNSGFIISENNGKGVPNVYFYAL